MGGGDARWHRRHQSRRAGRKRRRAGRRRSSRGDAGIQGPEEQEASRIFLDQKGKLREAYRSTWLFWRSQMFSRLPRSLLLGRLRRPLRALLPGTCLRRARANGRSRALRTQAVSWRDLPYGRWRFRDAWDSVTVRYLLATSYDREPRDCSSPGWFLVVMGDYFAGLAGVDESCFL